MTMLACAAVLFAFVATAHAEVRYDRKLEEAVKARIAKKIGDIRGGFEPGDAPEFVQPDPMVTGTVTSAEAWRLSAPSAPRPGSLTLAVERKASRRIF